MLSTGEIIRVLMDEKNLKVTDLAKMTELKETAILNIIYNRTNRAEYLNRIATALEVSLDTLLRSKKSYSINTEIYSDATKIVFNELDLFNIKQIPSGTLQEYIDSAYENLIKTENINSTSLYIKGMIEGHIKFGITKKGKLTN